MEAHGDQGEASSRRARTEVDKGVARLRLPLLLSQVTFVGDNFTRKAPKYERFIRPAALRFKKANVTHPELATTFHLEIIGVKKNPSSQLYTQVRAGQRGGLPAVPATSPLPPQLGVITKGTVIEVNVSELGLVTTSGKVRRSRTCPLPAPLPRSHGLSLLHRSCGESTRR